MEEQPPILGRPGASPEFVRSFIALYGDRLERLDVLLGERGDPSFRRRLIDGINASVLWALPGYVLTLGPRRSLQSSTGSRREIWRGGCMQDEPFLILRVVPAYHYGDGRYPKRTARTGV